MQRNGGCIYARCGEHCLLSVLFDTSERRLIDIVFYLLASLYFQGLRLTSHLHNATKIDACTIKHSELAQNWKILEEKIEERLNLIETILSTQLSDDTYRGIINVIKAFRSNAPNDEIYKALVS